MLNFVTRNNSQRKKLFVRFVEVKFQAALLKEKGVQSCCSVVDL